MSRHKCLSCGGEYDDVTPEGFLYFHACAPVADPQTGKVAERPDKRDENIRVDRGFRRLGMVAEGRGRTPAAPGGGAEKEV